MTSFQKAQHLYNKAIGRSIDDDDLDTIIAWPESEITLLFACADLVRRKFFNDIVDPCALMNIKAGGCGEDCAFCAQSSHNTAKVAVKDLADADEIIKNSKAAYERKLTFCVVSSGRRLSREEVKIVADALRKCKGELHASLGILSGEEFVLLKNAGVSCYNHNLETSRRFYPEIVSTHDYKDRIKTVRAAKKAGLFVCCGGIFGMGETWDDRKALCRELRALDVDTIPINFFMPIPGTRVKPPLESPIEFLKIVSLFRLALPEKTIKVCGGRELNLGPMQALMFCAGANGYISGDYLTTKGDSVESDDTMIQKLRLRKKHSKKSSD
ncbi:MAG TPA: biotin synthase BioB [Chitinivibrionales bacterium]|nr:biotin synthase BioB [Chitinivibrionales bacterium]